MPTRTLKQSLRAIERALAEGTREMTGGRFKNGKST